MAAIAPSGRALGANIDQSLPIQRSPGRPDDSLLCRRCTELLSFDKQISMTTGCEWEPRWPGEKRNFVLQLTWPVDDLQGLLVSILANSAQGCEFCKVVATELDPDLRSEFQASSFPGPTGCIQVGLARRLTQPIHQVIVLIQRKSNHSGNRLHELYLDKYFDLRAVYTDPTYQPYLDIQLEFDWHMASSGNLNFARECLKRCVVSHTDCAVRNDLGCSQAASQQLLSQVRERPSRLLDLDRLHENSLQLCNTAGIEDAQYAALSYCWGTGARLVTTGQNIIWLGNGFSFDALPATIADAVTVTANLGIRYLWVDSFCIIQDSADDKNVELSKMADIYQNAHVTIIAASATSAFSGFLAPRKGPEARVRVPIYDESKGFVGVVILRDLSDVESLGDTPDATETRAWCLQEGILSTRCLVFSKLYLYWCCQEVPYARQGVTAKARIEFPDNIFFRTSRHYVDRLPDVFRSGRRGTTLTDEDRIEIHNAWSSIMTQFSCRDITDPTDKFRALAGLGKAFHDTTQDRYLAGMWESTLLYNLVWWVKPRKMWPNSLGWWVKPRKTWQNSRCPLLAPSWSWLSAGPGSVELGYQHDAFQARGEPEIIHVDIKLTHSAEPFGHIASGALQLRGRLTKSVVWAERAPCSQPQPLNGVAIRPIDIPADSEWSDHNRSVVSMDRPVHDGTGKPWQAYTRAQPAEVWALQFDASHSEPPGPSSKGILLIPTPDGSSGTFMRVGHYYMAGWTLDHVQPELVTII